MGPESQTWLLVGVVVLLLTLATAVGQFLKRQPELGLNPAAVASFNKRLRAWWIICCMVAFSFFLPREVTVIAFGLIAFMALREFITLTPTRKGDHRALFWVFFLFTPLQFVLVMLHGWYDTYDFYITFIPVYGFLFIPARIALAGDFKRFLERVAKIQSGLLICVYCLSFAPAILYLDLGKTQHAPNQKLLFFFVVMVLFYDAMQYVLGRAYGKHVIAPNINETRTWEGVLGGIGSCGLLGMFLYWATPFGTMWQSGLMSILIAVMGFGGGMTMSAIKRDRGVKDYGTLVIGHSGVLDRIDSLCFAAPVFFHVTRVCFTGS